MELRDLIVTPIIIFLAYAGAYWIRPRVTDSVNRKYFIPALTVRIIGALAVGFLYQFYYDGGDTFNFHTHGSRHVWEAFMDSPMKGMALLFSSGNYPQGTFEYSSKIYFYNDASSFFVIRLTSLFDLITISSYSGTAILFALFSFVGSWAFFIAMYRQMEPLYKSIAMAILFIPSVVFWGSGLLKDTVTFACLGLMTYCISNIFIKNQKKIFSFILLIVAGWIIFSIKKYILLCYLPAIFLWINAKQLNRIRSSVLKAMIVPFMIVLLISIGYYSVIIIGEDDPRYALNKIAETSKITAYDIGFYSGRNAGSGYNLGDLDGTFLGMLKLAPNAIIVSLFRPYLWEVKNPLMLLSAIEAFLVLLFTLFVIIRKRIYLFKSLMDPNVIFCLSFSLTFAFAVGVSTFNFGTLSRYKIPLLPFYLLALIFILNYENKDKKLGPLAEVE